MNPKLTPPSVVILVAGAFMVVGSFLDFWKIGALDVGENAWSRDLFFPVTIIPVLCAIVMLVHVALTSFTRVRLPPTLLGLGWNQLHLALGFQAAVMMLAFLVQERGPVQLGTGFYLMLLSGIGLAIGALLRNSESQPRF
jgi:hypothetical protein